MVERWVGARRAEFYEHAAPALAALATGDALAIAEDLGADEVHVEQLALERGCSVYYPTKGTVVLPSAEDRRAAEFRREVERLQADPPPIGWRRVNGRLVHAPEEIALRNEARALRAAGQTHRQIVDTLRERGRTTRGGRPLVLSAVQRLLEEETGHGPGRN